MDPQRLRRLANDRIDAINAVVQRWERAWVDNHTPSRRPSLTGRISGDGEADITYGDPTGQTAAILLDTLDRIGEEMKNRREDDWQLAKMLEDFAPARNWDNGIRRCSEEGCAREHHATGLCQTHYRREQRAQAS